jgi:hypothetical protein
MILGKLLDSGIGGVVPTLAKEMYNDYKDDKEDDKKKKEARAAMAAKTPAPGMKKGGMVKSSASKRADGCAQRGKTKGRMV